MKKHIIFVVLNPNGLTRMAQRNFVGHMSIMVTKLQAGGHTFSVKTIDVNKSSDQAWDITKLDLYTKATDIPDNKNEISGIVVYGQQPREGLNVENVQCISGCKSSVTFEDPHKIENPEDIEQEDNLALNKIFLEDNNDELSVLIKKTNEFLVAQVGKNRVSDLHIRFQICYANFSILKSNTGRLSIVEAMLYSAPMKNLYVSAPDSLSILHDEGQYIDHKANKEEPYPPFILVIDSVKKFLPKLIKNALEKESLKNINQQQQLFKVLCVHPNILDIVSSKAKDDCSGELLSDKYNIELMDALDSAKKTASGLKRPR